MKLASRTTIVVLLLLLVSTSAFAATKAGITTTAVHETFVTTDSGDYYGSGNDDSFAEYGVTTFNFSNADFPEGGIVTEILLTLTVNDRSFSDGDAVEIFFTTDTAADLGGDFSALSYNPVFVNGIDASQFSFAPASLGVFSIPEMAGRAGGETDTFSLQFSLPALSALALAIGNGENFQIIVAATDATHDLTYSGVGNTFDPGDPLLEIRTENTVATESVNWGEVKSSY